MVACTFGDKSHLKRKNGIIGKRRRGAYMLFTGALWVPFGLPWGYEPANFVLAA